MEEEQDNKPISSVVLGKLPKFSGKGSIRSFLKTIDKRGTLENWSDADKANIVRYLCVDSAEVFIDSNPDLEECSYTDLCDRLAERFKIKFSTSEAYAELLSVRQSKQSISDYTEKIERTAANVSDVIDDLKEQESRNALLISVFMAGLDSHLKRALIARKYEEFSDLIHAAKQCESTFIEPRRHISSIDITNSMPNHMSRTNEINVCWNCGLPGHIRRQCRRVPPSHYYNNHNHRSFSYSHDYHNNHRNVNSDYNENYGAQNYDQRKN